MSLPVPDLDNKRFAQFVEEARKLIPGYSSEWTDHNLSDPGITLIDLFAWLSEIALYRINLVTESHRLKYLQLLGVKPQPAKQARVDLTFTSAEERLFSKGTRVWTKINDKKVYFQLEEDITIVPATIEKIIVDERTSGIYDRSHSNLDEKGDLFFAPFGNEIQKDCAMYLGFVLDSNAGHDISLDNLSLMCYLYEKDLLEIKQYETEKAYKIERTGVKWEFWTGCHWSSIVPQDDTEGFRKNGKILFKNLKGWTESEKIPELGYDASDTRNTYFWIRCVVKDALYEYPPRIESLRLNTFSAIHGLMVKDNNSEIVSNGLPGQIFKLRGTPVVDNTLKLSIEEEWIEVHNFEMSGPFDRHFILDRRKGEIKFGNGKKGIVPQKGSTITMMECSIVGYEEWISQGLKGQTFELKGFPQTSGVTFKLLVDKDEWTEVDGFEGSGTSDKHFILDRENRRIKFGDGKRGKIPPKSSVIKVVKFSMNGSEEWTSKGLPGQTFMSSKIPIFKLEVGEDKWLEVDDFEGSGPFDKHFVLDRENRRIKFGDRKRGIIPPSGSTIKLIKYSIANYEEWISKGSSDQIFRLNETPISRLTFELLVDKDEWTEVDDFEGSGPLNKHYILDRENREIKFGNGKKGIVPPEGSIIKVIKFSITGFEEWTSKGLPGQFFELKKVSTTPKLTFKLLVEDDTWTEVDDFEGSWHSDKHFVLSKEKGEIKFGDGLMGLVPSQGSIIRVLEYMTGGGEEGNLMPERSWEIGQDFKGSIRNYLASTGGKEAQTVEEAIEDFCRDLKTPYTAVTLQDFEKLAKNTPGLRISGAKAISDYKPKPKPDEKELEESRESITVVIIPYTPLDVLKIPPEPSEEFKKAVCVHLDKHRILGTDIHVISPIYVKVIVTARIVPKDTFRDDDQIRKNVIEKLNLFLHPIKGGMDEKGWPIGRNIYLSDIYNVIENVEGVNCVLRLSISGDKNASTDADGNLILKSRLASVYSGAHSLEIFREKNQCFLRGDSY